MSRTSVVPLTQTSSRPVCHDCGWEGAPARATTAAAALQRLLLEVAG